MKKILFCFALIMCSTSLFAQGTISSLSSDDLFTAARKLAFNGQRDSARVLLNMALQKSPDYADIRIFLARTYAWDGKRDDARKEIGYVLLQNPDNKEALSLAVDIELWDDKPERGLEYCVRGLHQYPNDEGFLLQKAKALKDLHRDNEALITLTILQDVNPSNMEAANMVESIKKSFLSQSVSINETYDGISDRSASHLIYLQYNRSTFFGTVIGRINYARRFGYTGVQAEVDAYPRIVNGIYAYVNYGYSDPSLYHSSSLFPKHRGGLELFFKLPASFEGSFGSRYLNFGPGSEVTIYTGSVGYYYRDYWFSLRPYITPSNLSFSRSLSFTTRYYYHGTGDEYLSAKIGAGYSPDDRNYEAASGTLYFLKAQTVGIGILKPLSIISDLTANFDYTNQELIYSPGSYQKVYSVSIGYKYKF